MKDDAGKAVAELQREKARLEAVLSAKELADLKEFLEKMREQMKALEGDQQQLLEATRTAPDILLPDVKAKQGDLEKKAGAEIEKAREVREKGLASKKAEDHADAAGADPGEAAAPAGGEDAQGGDMPNGEGEPKGEGEGEGEGQPKGEGDGQPKGGEGAPKDAMPDGAGEKGKSGKSKSRAGGEPDGRDALRERGERTLGELNEAEGGLAADEAALGRLLEQLKQAAADPGGEPHDGQPHDGQADPSAATNSAEVQQALAMAARMKAMKSGRNRSEPGRDQAHAPHPPGASSTPNLQGSPPGIASESVLNKLDLNTRTVLLKMPPRVREEILQGMREQAPEGYSKFIQDYFQRLTEVKK